MGSSSSPVVYDCCKGLARIFCGFFFRLRAYGQDNLPERGGALLLSNHQSYLDPPIVGIVVRRRVAYMARDTLFRNLMFGGLLRLLNVFPVKRGRPDHASIRLAIDYLRSGQVVVMFPEATRTRDGALQQVKGGFRLLVERANVPVIPVAIDGAFRAWPRDRLLPRPRRVRVMYGRAIPQVELEGLSDDEAAARAFREISSLLEKLRRLP